MPQVGKNKFYVLSSVRFLTCLQLQIGHPLSRGRLHTSSLTKITSHPAPSLFKSSRCHYKAGGHRCILSIFVLHMTVSWDMTS